jgi:hypothetical protein
MPQEGPPVSEWRKASEGKPVGVAERDQSGEEQAAEQLTQLRIVCTAVSPGSSDFRTIVSS